jgi:hypothetical protein
MVAAGLLVAGLAGPAAAQQAVPILSIEFTVFTIPLNPLLSGAIAAMLAVLGLVVLRRRAIAPVLRSIVALVLFAPLLLVPNGALIQSAQAVLPSTDLPLLVSPAVLAEFYAGDVHALNVSSHPVTITAVTYIPQSDYYLDTANTTCVPGLTLQPGKYCVVEIRTLG